MREVDAERAYGHDVGQEFAHWIRNQKKSQGDNGRGRISEVEEDIEGAGNLLREMLVKF